MLELSCIDPLSSSTSLQPVSLLLDALKSRTVFELSSVPFCTWGVMERPLETPLPSAASEGLRDSFAALLIDGKGRSTLGLWQSPRSGLSCEAR